VWLVQLGFFERPASSLRTTFPISGDSYDPAVPWKIFSYQVVFGIGDENVIVEIDAQMFRSVQRRFPGIASIATCAFFPGPDDRSDFSRAINDPQSIAASLEDINIFLPICGNGAWIEQRSVPGLGAITRNTFLAVACDGRDDSRTKIDHANPSVIQIG
jgi:hypothetical protein